MIGGPVCGAILCAATCLQQLGIGNNTGSPGKEAFITALYIVIVPVLGKKRPPKRKVSCSCHSSPKDMFMLFTMVIAACGITSKMRA